MQVPYVALTASQKEFCFSALVQCSVSLKRWTEVFEFKNCLDFRKKLFKASKNPKELEEMECVIPAEMLSDFRFEQKFILSIQNKTHPCLENRTIEWSMLCGFSNLARRLSRKWFKAENLISGMTLDDYESESFLTMLDCIYAYSNPMIEFSSFIWRAITNKMIAVKNLDNLFCPLKRADQKLLRTYNKTAATFNDAVNFDAVVEKMQITEEERLNLILAMKSNCLWLASQHVNDDGGSEEGNCDYTSFRSGIDKEVDKKLLTLEVQEAIVRADLSDFERKVLVASMNPHHGWQTEIAAQTINPKTQKPYSRMWIGIVLNSAREKVAKELTKKKTEQVT